MIASAVRVLLASSELYPVAKTGGLADVCGALPAALERLGAEVRVVLPAYDSAIDALEGVQAVADLVTIAGLSPVRVLAGRIASTGLHAWLVDCPALYQRPGTPYQDAAGHDWPDNALRFGLFSHAVARLALGVPQLAWTPDVVHCHDWHTGLVPYLVGRAGGPRPRTVFTIHNAAFQGNFPLALAPALGLPPEALTPGGMEFYGQLSFLKAGIRYADRLTTVSPTYARELCTPQFGCGLEGLIASRAQDFVGILNGIDTRLWNPATDGFIAERYSRQNPLGKEACKADFQRECAMQQDPQAPLVAFASRLTSQKMADVTLQRLPRLLERHPRMQFALLGCGEHAIEAGFSHLAGAFPGRVGIHIGYQEASEHRLHAGADVLLHGSRFEPCGLAQMYAMRYGALPVVRRVGGLADTVAEGENGFVFDEASPQALEEALERCLDTYAREPFAWRELQSRAMQADFGWERPASAYLDVYGCSASS
jgi:starch synthase